jgi:dihydroneopterin aldolase
VSDRVVLANMSFRARHGVLDWEKTQAQRFEVDVELELDLEPAGRSDDLAATVDYGALYDRVREIAEGPSVELLETLAARIATGALDADARIEAVTVRVRKPEVKLDGPLDYAGVEITRGRAS